MTLIIEAGLISYFGKGSRSGRQFVANEINPELADILSDRTPLMLAENAREMNGVDTYCLRNGRDRERVGKMRVD
jgi:hypothetical protein